MKFVTCSAVSEEQDEKEKVEKNYKKTYTEEAIIRFTLAPFLLIFERWTRQNVVNEIK